MTSTEPNKLRCAAALLLVALRCAMTGAGEKGDASPRAIQIAQWIRQLDDDAFSTRELASRNLAKSGNDAIEALAAAATGRSLEVTRRAVGILDELSSPLAGATSRAARQKLVELSTSDHRAAARQAAHVLRTYQDRVVAALENCGAEALVSDERIIGVDFGDAEELGENLRLLHELPDLERLSFSTPLMDDAGLARLQGLPRLRELNLFQSRIGDAGLKYLATLPSLRRVPMGETRVTDAGLVHLKDLTELEYVGLRADRISDAGLVHLKRLTALSGLNLSETKITDAGLIHLRHLTKLKSLYLARTQVSDAGLEHLKVLKELQSLDLAGAKVTEQGVAALKDALPDLEVSTAEP